MSRSPYKNSLERAFAQKQFLIRGLIAFVVLITIIAIWSIFTHQSQSQTPNYTEQSETKLNEKRKNSVPDTEQVDNGNAVYSNDPIWKYLPYTSAEFLLYGLAPENGNKIRVQVQYIPTAKETELGKIDENYYNKKLTDWFVEHKLERSNYEIIVVK